MGPFVETCWFSCSDASAYASWLTSCALQHLALTINEELHVQERLLEDFEEEVDVSHNKMRAAQKRIKGVLTGSNGDWRGMLLVAALIILLMVILLLAFKVVL